MSEVWFVWRDLRRHNPVCSPKTIEVDFQFRKEENKKKPQRTRSAIAYSCISPTIAIRNVLRLAFFVIVQIFIASV